MRIQHSYLNAKPGNGSALKEVLKIIAFFVEHYSSILSKIKSEARNEKKLGLSILCLAILVVGGLRAENANPKNGSLTVSKKGDTTLPRRVVGNRHSFSALSLHFKRSKVVVFSKFTTPSKKVYSFELNLNNLKMNRISNRSYQQISQLIKSIDSDKELRIMFKSQAEKVGMSHLFTSSFESKSCALGDDNDKCTQKKWDCVWEIVGLTGLGIADVGCIVLEPCGFIGGTALAIATGYQLRETLKVCKDATEYCKNQDLDANENGIFEYDVEITILDDRDDKNGDGIPDWVDCDAPLVDCFLMPDQTPGWIGS